MLEALFAGIVCVFLPLRAWRRYRRGAPPTPAGRYLPETAVLIAVLAALLWRNGVTLDAIGVRAVSPLRWVGDLTICLAAIVGPDVFLVWRLTRQARRAAALPAPEGMVADALAAHRVLGSFVAVTTIGAVWEELCFRATLFLIVPETTGGRLLGIAAGSLLFGATHLRNGPKALAYSGFFGLLFSLLYLLTGNLIAVIVAHAAGNLLTVWQWAPRIERARHSALGHAPAPVGRLT